MGRTYEDPKLVLYTHRVSSACGLTSAATGPFYCPEDQKAYLDLSFFHEMKDGFNAPGEFAQAYVVAHEIGHDVQNKLGILQRAHGERARSDERRSNAISVRVELQADCFAGVWAYHAHRAKHIIEQGDVEAALNAASAWGTIACSARPMERWCRTHSLMAAPPRGCIGSNAAYRAAALSNATRFRLQSLRSPPNRPGCRLAD